MFRRRTSSDNDARILIANSLVDIDPDYAVSASDLPNRGTGGSGYDLDTNVGTAANRKIHPSGSCLLFGASGDYVSTPDSAANSITGDIDIRVKVALDDWTPSSSEMLVGKYLTSAGNRCYRMYIAATSGNIGLQTSADGTSSVSGESTSAPSVSDGGEKWVRATLDVDDGSGNRVYKFYTSDDGETWSQLGSTVTSSGTTSILDGDEVVAIGSNSDGSESAAGIIYRAQIYNGIDGTLAVDFDPTKHVSGTTFSSGGVTWTLSGNSFIQNTGHDVLHSIGSNGLETSAGQTINSPSTVFMVAKFSSPTPPTTQRMLDARSSASDRWVVFTGTNHSIFQGSGTIALSQAYDDGAHVWTAQFNGDATTKLTVSGVGSVTGNAGSANLDFGSLMIENGESNSMQGYIARLLVFDYALSETQVSAIQNYLSAYYGGI